VVIGVGGYKHGGVAGGCLLGKGKCRVGDGKAGKLLIAHALMTRQL